MKDRSLEDLNKRIAELEEELKSVRRKAAESESAEKESRKAKNRLKALLDAMPDMVFDLDSEGRFLDHFTPDPSSLYADPKLFIGKNILEVIPGESGEKLISAFNKCLETSEKVTVEYSLQMPNGIQYFESSMIPVGSSDTKPKSVLSVVRDITTRKLAEEAVKKSEYEKATVLNATNEHVIYYNNDLEIIWANRAAADSLGLNIEVMKGRKCHDLWYGANTPCHACPVEKTLKTGESFESEVTTPDNMVWHIRSYPVFDDAGKLAGAVEIAMDITKNKRTETALKESEERYRSLAEAAQDFIFIVDPNDIVLYVNSYAAAQLGCTPDELVGKPRGSLFPGNIATRQHKNIVKVLESHELVHVETVTAFKDSFRWLDSVLVPLKNSDGEISAVLGISRDITGRKQAEEQLLKSKRESEFYLDLMSHDLTNFNQTILGNLTLIEMQGGLNEKQVKYLQSCKRQLSRSENLISKVRAFSQVKHIEKHHLKKIDLNSVVAEAVRMIKTLYPAKNIIVKFDPSGHKYTDATELLDSVAINVLDNAVKHSHSDKIELEIEIRDAANEPESFWELCITDNGPGVPDNIKEKIFDRFSKISSEKGMGLGLSLAREITEKFGGSIWVEDRTAGDYTSGSMFVIAIPKA